MFYTRLHCLLQHLLLLLWCVPTKVCVYQLKGPIVMYGLRLFNVVLQELHCLPKCLHVCIIRVRGCYRFTKFHCSTIYCLRLFTLFTTVIIVVCSLYVYTKFYCCVSELHGHLCPYRYGLRLFIVVLQELQCLPNCVHVNIIRVIGSYHVLFVYTFKLLR